MHHIGIGRRQLSRAAAVTAFLAAAAHPASAQQEQQLLFEWRGRVDQEIQIGVQGGRRPTVRPIGRNEPRAGRFRDVTSLPRHEGTIVVERVAGRGSVDVIEQPSSRNGYLAVVRVRDDAGGEADYDVRAYWRPTGGGYVVDERGRDGSDRDRARGRRGRDDGERGRDRDGSFDGATTGTVVWSGSVDTDADIIWRGTSVATRSANGARTNARWNRSGGALPSRNVVVTAERGEGRGRVTVVQQPSRSNDYTGIVRISDPDGGAGNYRIVMRWQ